MTPEQALEHWRTKRHILAWELADALATAVEQRDELVAIERRAQEMAAHEPGFGGSVARYILDGYRSAIKET